MTLPPDVPPLHVRVMGDTVAIAVPDQATRYRSAYQWSRAVVPSSEPPAGSGVAVPAAAAPRTPRDYRLTPQVTLAALSVTSGQRINLHAGGLADEGRRVLAIVGKSGTGKTTATRLLAQRLDYLSDETVSIAPAGTVPRTRSRCR